MHPITDEEQFFRDFPNLIRRGPQSNFRVTSPATETPNCVAYAAGDPDRIWWPGSMFPVAWPREAPAEESVAAFVAAFGLMGYHPCDSAEMEPRVEKVAIFAIGSEAPTHVAIQPADRNGWWRSKIGSNVDIEHELYAVSGPLYGAVARVLARPRRGRYRLPELRRG